MQQSIVSAFIFGIQKYATFFTRQNVDCKDFSLAQANYTRRVAAAAGRQRLSARKAATAKGEKERRLGAPLLGSLSLLTVDQSVQLTQFLF